MALSETQRATLRAVCDTFYPALERPDDPTGFWARKASDLGVEAEVERYLEGRVDPVAREGLKQLLDVLTAQDFAANPQEVREQMLIGFAAFGPEVAAGIDAFRSLTLLHAYGVVGPDGKNPNWPVLGYPGPQGPTPQVEKPIRPLEPKGDRLELDADVCVVGSGSGGGVIAGVLSQAGHRVVVLEMGAYYNEADFNQLELWAYEHLYYKGGLPPTSDGNVVLLAGSNLGGGSTVNWMTCFPTRPAVRAEWAAEHGLEASTGPTSTATCAPSWSGSRPTRSAATSTARTFGCGRAARSSAGPSRPSSATQTPRPTTRRVPPTCISAIAPAAARASRGPTYRMRPTPELSLSSTAVRSG